jgi:hypothetical protein
MLCCCDAAMRRQEKINESRGDLRIVALKRGKTKHTPNFLEIAMDMRAAAKWGCLAPAGLRLGV